VLPILGSLMGDNSFSASIRCPASGLILHSTYEDNCTVELEDSPPTGLFSLLLPDDEPDPVTGDRLFADAVRLIRDHMDVMARPSRYFSMGARDPSEVEELLQRQLAANPRVYPALPHWKDHLDEARTRHPSLRPHIKHLR
jgi:hypothetical protein